MALALAAACIALYSQSYTFGFLNFDDGSYITENQWVRGGFTAAGVRWAFTTIDYFYWQPLTWLSHMLDCQLFDLRPGGHHLVNLGFHVANVLLVFALLLRLTGAFWRSATVAAFFGLHPLRIESVVWAAERKDVLSALLYLLAIWCYLDYVQRPTRPRYLAVCGVFALGLMAKPMVLTLPLILLLLDWWPLGRRAFEEKVPLFAMAGISSFLTSIGMSHFAGLNWANTLTLGQRIANSLLSCVKYLELTFWPHDLAILYPFRLSVPAWQAALAASLLAAITALALWQARRRPYLIVGWLWFSIALVPALGLVQTGWQSMADRFTYVPHVGLGIAVVWGAADLLAAHRKVAAAMAVAAALLLAAGTWRQLPVWHDSVSVFQRAVAVTDANFAAQHYLASALDAEGRFDESFSHHAEAVRLRPDYGIAVFAYGIALERRGDTVAAIQQFRRAAVFFPHDPDVRRRLDLNLKLLTGAQ
ncbi:MAG: hypothetical protein ABI759_08380 [Candidatus Solibacter sp.]